MSTTRTKPILTIVILLIVLAVLSIASLLTSSLGGAGVRIRQPGTFNGTPAPGGNFPGGNGDDAGGVRGGNAGNFQGRGAGGGFNPFGVIRSLGISPQVFPFVSIGIAVLGILLVLLCAYGVWKGKKAALNWAMVLAVVFLLAALPGLFFGGRFNLLRTAINVLNIGAAVTILALGILPSVRDSVE